MSAERVVSLNGCGNGFRYQQGQRANRRYQLVPTFDKEVVRENSQQGKVNRAARKRTILMFATTWCLGSLLLLWVWNGVASADDQTASIRVVSGDTLWKIAQRVEPHQDPRVVTNQILKLNQMSGSDSIYPGQVLKVPTS